MRKTFICILAAALCAQLSAASPQALVFAADSAEQELQLESPSAWETLRQYVVEGVWHIWIGFDHILFLLSLLLPSVLVRTGARWSP